MAQTRPRRHGPMTVEEYLEMERESPVRHEFVGGAIYAFAGASEAHNLIALSVASHLRAVARDGPCRVLMGDVKLFVSDQAVYYPDVMVVCDPDDNDTHVKHRPCLLIEVLSPSTASVDRREKLLAYRGIPSLRAYVMLYQDVARATVHSRDEHGSWWEDEVPPTGRIRIPCPETELSMAEIYEDVFI